MLSAWSPLEAVMTVYPAHRRCLEKLAEHFFILHDEQVSVPRPDASATRVAGPWTAAECGRESRA